MADFEKDNIKTLPIAGLNVERVVQVVEGEYFGPDAALETEITGLEINSKNVKPGNIFAAFVGEKVDGNKFSESVINAGAAVVLSAKRPEEIAGVLKKLTSAVSTLPIIKVDNVGKACEKLAIYRRQLLHIPIVAIIGSVGKTSTKEAIANVLERRFNVLKTAGNLNNQLGLPMTIMSIKDCHDVAVLEMGISDFGEMSVLANIARPDVLVFTNVCDCHLETLGNKAGVLRAKSEAFDYLHDRESVAILNGDDECLRSVKNIAGKYPIFFGIDNGRNIKAKHDTYDNYVSDLEMLGLRGSKGILHLADDDAGHAKDRTGAEVSTEVEAEDTTELTAKFDLPLPGLHSVYNMLAAASVAHHLGMSIAEIINGISLSKNIAGHGAIIALPKLTILDESYNANPESMRASLNLLENCDTRKVAILGDMAELGPNEEKIHRNLGQFISNKKIDTVVAIGPLSKNIMKGIKNCSEEKTSGTEQDGVIAAINTPQILYFNNVEEFLSHASEIIQTNDSVLVKASHSMNFAKIVEALKQLN